MVGSPQAQADLARSFGSLHVHPIYPSIEDVPEVMVLDRINRVHM
jgi:taurine dioxygenase